MGKPDSGAGQVFEADDSGVVAEHAPQAARPFFASPTTADKKNALSLDVVPIACLNLGDVNFEFDSSVVLEPAGRILSQLPALRQKKPGAKGALPLVSIFGHADPSGSDDYNKALSGRRAKAVYGLLTHKPAIWDDLFRHPFGGDDWARKMSVAGQAETLGLPASTPRKDVFLAMMQAMCPQPLEPADFLGRGADAGGKADFQGCGEFNPLLLLSADEQATLSKPKRNSINVVDRRVVVFLFRPEIILDVGNWPCPRATEGAAACHKRFFANAQLRLAPGPERKSHKGPNDETFACRFYDRIAGASPCEQILEVYRVRLFDKFANPLPRATFTLTDGKRTVKGQADDQAFLTVRDIKVPADVHVQWSPAGDSSKTFEMDVHVDIEGDDDAAALRRLHNLGYEGRPLPQDDVRAFQQDHAGRFPAMTASGKLDAATRDALREVNDECNPVVRTPPPASPGSGKGQGDKVQAAPPADAESPAP